MILYYARGNCRKNNNESEHLRHFFKRGKLLFSVRKFCKLNYSYGIGESFFLEISCTFTSKNYSNNVTREKSVFICSRTSFSLKHEDCHLRQKKAAFLI